MANLLDQASIVLTPTAYDDGKVLCAKPSEPPYGDFDFSRNSAATRVNAKGLVENVQILSSNLVQNGDFSEEGTEEVSNGSFSQEGSELITNGNFDTDSDWTKLGSWTIENGKLTTTGGASLVYQNITSAINKTYKVVFEVSNYVSGEVTVGFGGALINPRGEYVNANGIYTQYLTKTDTNQSFGIKPNNFIGSIDNVSCVEVGQDWTLGTGWSIGEDKVVCDGTSSILRQPNVIPLSTIVKVSFNINDYVSGNVTVKFAPNQYPVLLNGNGTYTIYTNGDNTANGDLQLISNSFIGSITNISVKEVGQNWDLGSGWEIAENKVIVTSTINQQLKQTLTTTIGKSYKVSLEILDITEGSIRIYLRDGGTAYFVGGIYASSGVYDFYFTSTETLNTFAVYPYGTTTASITNISVIEITDDTNLPRINYEGFSYQDVLGSELVTNGDFSDGSTRWSLTNFSIINEKAVIDSSNPGFLIQTSVTEIGKTYRVEFTVSDYVEGRLRLREPFINNDLESNPSNGTYVYYGVANGTGVQIQSRFSGEDYKYKIDNVSVKEVLGQEVVPGSGCGSWLFEPQSTNLIPYSEDFSNASWAHNTDVTTTNSLELAPNGKLDAYLIEYDGSGYSFIRTNLGSVPSTATTLSVFAKKGNWSYLGFRNFQLSGDNHTVFDFDTETFTNIEGSQTASFEVFSNGWYRIKVTQPTPAANSLIGYALTNSSGGELDTTGGQVANVHLFGAMLEEQSYATSYIPSNRAHQLHVTKTYAPMEVV